MPWELYTEVEKIYKIKIFIYMLEIYIFRNSLQNILDVLKGDFCEFGCPNDAQTPCWLRLWA